VLTDFRVRSQSLRANLGIVPQIRPRTILSSSFSSEIIVIIRTARSMRVNEVCVSPFQFLNHLAYCRQVWYAGCANNSL